jgi:DNA segregation ATPase FtsK/SpoIIIE-like protein
MQSNGLNIDWLNSSADRIEEILARRSLPAHVDGGDVGTQSVRFHLMPSSGLKAEHVQQAGPEIARAVGVSDVRISAHSNGFAIEVPFKHGRDLRLLPLIAALEDYEPLTAIVGMSVQGRPLSLDLKDDSSSHLWIEGPERTGKSELLRTLVVSLAMGNRPSHLKLMGIDIDGNDLTVIEALPHCLARLATDARAAQKAVYWLEQEIARRLRKGICQPAIVLVIDDLVWLDGAPSRGLGGSFRRMLSMAGRANVHILAASRLIENPHLRRTLSTIRLTKAVPISKGKTELGMFEFRSATGSRQRAKVALVSASDLQVVVARASARQSLDPHALRTLIGERLQ